MTLSKPAIAELHACLHECLDILLDHAASLPAALLTKELIGFGHPTMRQQFIHVLFTEAAWICELQSLPPPKLDTAAETIDHLRHMKKNVTGATIAYLDSISEHALNSNLDHYPVSWVGPQRTPGFILLHIITHGFHHKGQIVAMLRLLGYPPPDTDMQRA